MERYEVVKIANGFYSLPNEDIDEYVYFAHRVPKGIFFHETAAYLNGLSTRMPLIYVMSVKTGANVSRIKSAREDIVFKYVRAKNFDIGKTFIKTPLVEK